VDQQFAAGSMIFSEGQPSDHIFIIKQGKVEILKQAAHGAVRVALLEAGEVIGEMSLFNNGGTPPTRSASARALEDTVLEVLNRQEVHQMVESCPPQLKKIMDTILNRMKQTTQRLSEKESAAVEVECDFTEMMITPASEALQETIQPFQVSVEKLPVEIIGFSEDDAKPKRPNEGLLPIPCEGPPLVISKRHLLIEVQEKSVFLVDCGSRFGTWVNGKPIGKGKGKYKVALQKGEFLISLGAKESAYQLKLVCQ